MPKSRSLRQLTITQPAGQQFNPAPPPEEPLSAGPSPGKTGPDTAQKKTPPQTSFLRKLLGGGGTV